MKRPVEPLDVKEAVLKVLFLCIAVPVPDALAALVMAMVEFWLAEVVVAAVELLELLELPSMLKRPE